MGPDSLTYGDAQGNEVLRATSGHFLLLQSNYPTHRHLQAANLPFPPTHNLETWKTQADHTVSLASLSFADPFAFETNLLYHLLYCSLAASSLTAQPIFFLAVPTAFPFLFYP